MQIYLYQLRKEKGITQKELAQKLGISETAYRQKEKGQRAFKSDEMFIIADILGKDIGEIFSDSRTRNVVI
uniref:Helix-turn-helix XRE-family like protein n=1 Tax=Siphoviridae sp. ctnjE5 TaxID=2826456 RepID=A0A8S5NGY7_9CAUD|nr:MAG TPA: helix-turn-helix XRE-family like protein [Siphoviridae sp. ctnjE5]